MKAQDLYNAREQTEFCSGYDLQEFFLQELGDPSPSGKELIMKDHVRSFVAGCFGAMIQNGPSTAEEVYAVAKKTCHSAVVQGMERPTLTVAYEGGTSVVTSFGALAGSTTIAELLEGARWWVVS